MIYYAKFQELSYQNTFRNMLSRTGNFKKTFYSYCISEWNKLDGEIKTQRREMISDYEVYKCYKCYTFKIHDPKGLRFLTRLRMDFSQSNEHNFRHCFSDTVSPICACGSEIDSAKHFHLRCRFFALKRNHLSESLNKINPHPFWILKRIEFSALWVRKIWKRPIDL